MQKTAVAGMANQAICFIKRIQAINRVLPKSKRLTGRSRVRQTGRTGRCGALAWEHEWPVVCSDAPPKLCHQCFAKKPQIFCNSGCISCSVQVIPTTTCRQVYGRCKTPRLSQQRAPFQQVSEGSANPSKNVSNYQSKQQDREMAHKAHCIRNAGSHSLADAKVCVSSKKQTNSQLKSLC